MALPVPGQTESAYLGLAVVGALLDTLVKKKIVTTSEVTAIYRAAAKELIDSGNMLAKRGASFLTDRVLAKK